ncbi:hypothetical protein EBU94_09040, partial [bacterium]|nr:hypothetical protein [bacterium]
ALTGLMLLAGFTTFGQKKKDVDDLKDLVQNDPKRKMELIQNLGDNREIDDVLNTLGVKEKDRDGVKQQMIENGKRVVNLLQQQEEIEGGGKEVLQFKTLTVKNAKELEDALDAYYAIESFDLTIDTIKKEPIVEFEVDSNTIYADVILGNDVSSQLFLSGEYELSGDITIALGDTLNKIKQDGWEVIGVEIEASTDKQRMDWTKTTKRKKDAEQAGWTEKTDKTGNKLLVVKRCEVLEYFFKNNGIKNIKVDSSKYDQGDVTLDEFHDEAEKMANKEPNNLRELQDQTQEHRYVKVKIKTKKVVVKTTRKEIEQFDVIKTAIVKMVRVLRQTLIIPKKPTGGTPRKGTPFFTPETGCKVGF